MKKQEMMKIAKEYKFGIADGKIVSSERAVELLFAHTNIMYVQFSNSEDLAKYDDLSIANEDGADYDLSQKYYI